MNSLLFIIKTALFDFSRNKARAFLTSLGILIGVLSVVLLIAFGLGLKKYIQDQFESLGTNLLRVVPGRPLQNGSFRGSSGAIGTIRFDEKDVATLKKIDNLEVVAPVFTKSVNASSEDTTEGGDLYASTEEIFSGLNLTIQYGDFFTKEDVDKRSKSVVIGPKIAEKLFGSADGAVGKTIKVEGQGFKVVGVLEAKGGGGFGGPDFDTFIYMPYKTAFSFNPDKKFLVIIIKSTIDADIEKIKEDINIEFIKRYKEDDYSVIEQKEILGAVSSIFGILNSVLVAIAAISLVVGGIGIMNIMYVTVTERTKEIGIRRAVGARQKDILAQFLVESVILSLIGGSMGLLLAVIIVAFVQQFFPAYIDLPSVVLALGVSSIIGVVFGVFPAKKAADLSPIDAIRYE
jgi:putative ABC transport system permease protein